VIVSNLVEGEYKLTVRYGGQNGSRCISCQLATNTIRVVRLGVRTPVLTSDGQVQFEVVTSFPGRETIIQASSNLLDWLAVSTNRPCTNAFTFSEPFAANRAQRFYRVWLPWE
jgi:peptidyl-tRNA hydrolase